jgi:aminoglycoside phosphotransferase (APT) family kinase protein
MAPFTLEDIPDSLARHLPARGRLEHPPQGMTSDVAFVTGADRSIVVKRVVNPIYLDWLRREHAALRALAGLGLPVPAALGYAEVDGPSGREGWLVTTRLPGISLWPVLLDAAPAVRESWLRELGKLLHRLHSTPLPHEFKERKDWLSRKLAQARRNLDWCDGSPELLAELERTRPAPVPGRLVHGDLSLDNVLIDRSGTLSLIDWSDGDSGDYRTDVALALQTEPETILSERELQAFHAGYQREPLDRGTRRWFEQLYEFF